MSYSVKIIPSLSDNYVYAICCHMCKQSIIIDVGCFADIDNYIHKNLSDYSFASIILTHHHFDHIDGVDEFRKKHGCKLYGSSEDRQRLPALDVALSEGDCFNPIASCKKLKFNVLSIAGHTTGHLGFYVPQLKSAFVGDLLFTLGCGRMVESDYKTFYQSIAKIKSLPADTLIYGSHEYTKANILFARSLNSSENGLDLAIDKDSFLKYLADLEQKISKNIPTVPVKLEDEKKFNPFMCAKTVEQFKALRIAKDDF